jgi:hypothetical protein
MAYDEAFHVTKQDENVIAGPMREPRNLEQAIKGSIHDDNMAQKLGLRGGTVAGSLHMEQFPPLLTHVFGQRWWETGGLSLYFRYATTDRERVQCFAREPEADAASQQDVRTEVWMVHENGERVADGTASVGKPDMQSTLRQRLDRVPTPKDLRILSDLEVGQTAEGVPTRAPLDRLEQRLSVIVEPLPDYTEESPWGGRVAPPSLMVGAMTAVQDSFLRRGNGQQRGVGLWGAIEIQHLKGPVFVDRDYRVRGTILAVSETPRTEYLWFESILSDPESEGDVASMLMMLRFMKASHPAWQ